MPKIKSVTTAVIQANFDYTYVCITSESGEQGFGEAFFSPGLARSIVEIGDLLIGRDPRDVKQLLQIMRLATSASSGAHGDGALMHAISGIETALWDLAGKIMDEPVWRLLGGKFRDSIPVYADLHAGVGLSSVDNLLRNRVPFWQSASSKTEIGDFYWQSAHEDELDFQSMITRIQQAQADGYRCVKLDMDVFEDVRQPGDPALGTAEIARIANRVIELREAIDESVEIAYDCHWRFDIPTAAKLNAAIGDARPYWLEDPVNPTGRGLARVASAGTSPIASGENAYSLEGIEELARDGGLDIATPDVQKVGGILESVQIADWTHRRGIGFAPHCIASPLGFTAAVHVMAVAPSVRYLEFHGRDVEFWSDLVTTPVISSGQAALPTGPGLGVEFDFDVLRKYAVPGEPFFGEPRS